MPRRLLRDGLIVEDDWRTLDGEPGAVEGALIVPFARWIQERDVWLARGGRLGVALAPADDVAALAPDLPRLTLVAVAFPAAGEGRGYSQGRLLRERWKFTGELRATGHVLRDHLFFLARCGFNSFELADADLEAAHAALATFSAAYQPSNDEGLAVGLRHR